MKKLTIKGKIMLLYTTLLAVLITVLFPVMYYLLQYNMTRDAKVLIQTDMARAVSSLVHEAGSSELSADLEEISSGTYMAIYSNKYKKLSGTLPKGFVQSARIRNKQYYVTRSDGHGWLVYDLKVVRKGKYLGWIRAVKAIDTIDGSLKNLKLIFMIVLPIYLLAALLGGYFVAKRALAPIAEITTTAKQIGYNDLSRRIRYSGVMDEVGILSETFDNMLDRLEDLIRHEKQFTSDVSHELRTPTAVIMASAEEALNGGKSTEEYRESLQNILKEAGKIKDIISQLLMIARSTEGKYRFKMERINVSLLAETVLEEIRESTEHRDIAIRADIESGIDMTCEQTLMMRLIFNLVDNAVKYNIPGGWIHVALKKEKDLAVLTVADGGIGIAENNLPRIWDRFFKADPSRPDSSPGLGLSIVKWIVDLHGGTIQAKSKIGKGSTFEARFPLKPCTP